MAQIAALLPPGAVLITGAIRVAEPVNPANPSAYNSIYVIDHEGSIAALYDKVHLVPFGEYLPFQSALEKIGLQQITKQRGGFLSADRRRLIAVPRAPLALPLICYEAIFPAKRCRAGERPGWMINLTNDGWFGNSTGPYQHLQQARVLAIAEGLPLVRAANTGISAVVDPLGRVLELIAARCRRRARLAVAAADCGHALCKAGRRAGGVDVCGCTACGHAPTPERREDLE